jgi:hypothetical protein
MKAILAHLLGSVDVGVLIVGFYTLGAAFALAALIVLCKRAIEEALR